MPVPTWVWLATIAGFAAHAQPEQHRGSDVRRGHLHYGLAVMLGLIGVKLTLHYLHYLHTVAPAVPEIPTWASRAAIVASFSAVTVTSLRASARTQPRVGQREAAVSGQHR